MALSSTALALAHGTRKSSRNRHPLPRTRIKHARRNEILQEALTGASNESVAHGRFHCQRCSAAPASQWAQRSKCTAADAHCRTGTAGHHCICPCASDSHRRPVEHRRPVASGARVWRPPRLAFSWCRHRSSSGTSCLWIWSPWSLSLIRGDVAMICFIGARCMRRRKACQTRLTMARMNEVGDTEGPEGEALACPPRDLLSVRPWQ